MSAHCRQVVVRTTPRGIAGIIGCGRLGSCRVRVRCFQRIIERIDCRSELVDFRFQYRIRSGKDTYHTWGFRFLLHRQARRFSLDLFQIAETFLRAETGDIQC